MICEALAHEGAVQPDQGDDVGDGRERDEVEPGEKVGRRPRVPEAALAQGAVQSHQGEKDDSGRAEMAEARQVVLPVRIDEGGSRRQALGGLVVVEHDRVEAEPRRLGERLVARRAAIDRDEQARALPGEGADRLDIGAVAFGDAVGDVDEERHAAGAQELAEQRRAAGAVDVVIAEDRHRLAALDRVGEARRRGRHVRHADADRA